MFSYSLETGAGEVRASRQLGEGEELSLAWVDPLSGAADRQKMLQVHTSSTSSTDRLILHVQGKYNFQCECEVCSLDPEQLAANDKIRREILGLTNNMEDIFVTNPQKAFRFAKMKVERMKAIRGEMVELLPRTGPTWTATSCAWRSGSGRTLSTRQILLFLYNNEVIL